MRPRAEPPESSTSRRPDPRVEEPIVRMLRTEPPDRMDEAWLARDDAGVDSRDEVAEAVEPGEKFSLAGVASVLSVNRRALIGGARSKGVAWSSGLKRPGLISSASASSAPKKLSSGSSMRLRSMLPRLLPLGGCINLGTGRSDGIGDGLRTDCCWGSVRKACTAPNNPGMTSELGLIRWPLA